LKIFHGVNHGKLIPGRHQKLNRNGGIGKRHTNVRMGMDTGLGTNPTVFKNKIPAGGIIHDFDLGDEVFFSEAFGKNRIFSGGAPDHFFEAEKKS